MFSEEEGKKFKKVLIVLVLICVAAVIIYNFFFSGQESFDIMDASDEPEETTEETEAESEEETAVNSDEEDYALTDYDISQDDIYYSGTATKVIGSIMVDYDTETAYGYSGRVSNYEADFLYFTDDEGEGITGAMYALEIYPDEMYDGDYYLETEEDAQAIADDYTYSGSGSESEWEECDDWFIRKLSGYDTDYDMAVIAFQLIPRGIEVDEYEYVVSFTMSEGENGVLFDGEPISEEAFNTQIEAVRELAPDSEFLQITYDELCDELHSLLYWKSASQTNYAGGIYELKVAQLAYFSAVYGVSSLDEFYEMTDEEREDAALKAMDPIGYAQRQQIMEQRQGDSEEEEE